MLKTVFIFELKYHARRLSTYVYFLMLFVLPLPSVSTEGTAKLLAHPPYAIAQSLAQYSALGFLVISAIFGMAVLRDFELNTHHMFFTTPVTRRAYLGGRFLGTAVVCVLIFTGLPLGIIYASSPWSSHQYMAPFSLTAYLVPFAMYVVPAVWFGGALCFALGALTRSVTVVYLQGVVLLAIYLGAGMMARSGGGSSWPALLDPFAMATNSAMTRFWTLVEHNTAMVPLSGVMLWNRAIWCLAGAIALVAVFRFFPFSAEILTRRRSRRIGEAPALATPGPAQIPLERPPLARPRFDRWNPIRQMAALTGRRVAWIVTDLPFLAILFVVVAMLVTSGWGTRVVAGVSADPVTPWMIGGLRNVTLLIVVATVLYGGELVWKERAVRFHEAYDALPVSQWITFASQLAALIVIQWLMLAVVMLTGITLQITQGFFDVRPGLYFTEFFVVTWPTLLPFAVLALFLQSVMPHKFLGHALAIGLFIERELLGFTRSRFLSFGSSPSTTYSDMNGYGPYVGPLIWFAAYWLAFAGVLGVVAIVMQRRGTDVGWRARLRHARGRLQVPAITAAVVCASAFGGIGTFLYQQVRVVGGAESGDLNEARRANYEKHFKPYETLPQPRIVAVDLELNLFPDRRSFEASGNYVLSNQTARSVTSILVVDGRNTLREVSFDMGVTEAPTTVARQYRVYDLHQPLLPGQTTRMRFKVAHEQQGFGEYGQATDLVENGTRIDRSWFPSVGYQSEEEIPYEIPRRRQGLAPRADFPAADDPRAQARSLSASDAGWMSFKATVSTARDQVVVAPGALVRDWQEGGRRYFQFDSGAAHIPQTFAFVSGRYQIERGRAADPAVEMYVDPRHAANVSRVIQAAEESLEYLSAQFGAAPFRPLRVVEVPAYPSFNAFPGAILLRETSGFVGARAARAGAPDPLFYSTALAVSEQWWGGQLIPAYVQGSTILIEMLAQYSTLMVLERTTGGPAEVRVQLRRHRDSYLAGRGSERIGEPPLVRAVPRARYLLPKSVLAMHAIKDALGEARLNTVLRAFLDRARYRPSPFVTATELVDHLRAALPDDRRHVMEDMFETITLFDNKIVSATWSTRPDGRYDVSLTLRARRIHADERGVERDVPVDDLIDVEIFVGTGALEKAIYSQKHRLTQPQSTLTIVVDAVPARAGIDPWLVLIDKQLDDNTMPVTRQGGSSK